MRGGLVGWYDLSFWVLGLIVGRIWWLPVHSGGVVCYGGRVGGWRRKLEGVILAKFCLTRVGEGAVSQDFGQKKVPRLYLSGRGIGHCSRGGSRIVRGTSHEETSPDWMETGEAEEGLDSADCVPGCACGWDGLGVRERRYPILWCQGRIRRSRPRKRTDLVRAIFPIRGCQRTSVFEFGV